MALCTFSALLFLLPLVKLVSALERLDVRAAGQTTAQCSSDFSWTDNSAGLSPCLLAATSLGACVTNVWTVPALVKPDDQYTQPNATTHNVCSCSWMVYNLLSACTACQAHSTIFPYYPANITLPGNTLVPFWATTDPFKWPNAQFDAKMAQSIANQAHADVSPNEQRTTKKKSSVGPIVGGVVGGVVGLAILVGLVIVFRIRQRRHPPNNEAQPTRPQQPPIHARSMSDLSQKSYGIGYARLGPQTPPAHPMMGQIPLSPTTQHTHSSSVHSLSYFPGTTMTSSPSPPPVRHMSPSPNMNQEDIVTPFMLRPTTPDRPLTDRKGDGSTFPVYEEPTLPPTAVQAEGSSRPRFNPPAYSPYPGRPPTDVPSQVTSRIERRGHRAQKGSEDTQHSWDSGRTRSPLSNNTSVIEDVISRVNFGVPETVSGTGQMSHTIATGQSGHMGQPLSPNIANPDPDPDPSVSGRDLA
ncbi:hypothetical protein BD779DRAFT_1470607 [Infundibulicybe gibba]|nr:hypothetical protein BD779DRAFT_1470607 [Infundibulicybe gibba]